MRPATKMTLKELRQLKETDPERFAAIMPELKESGRRIVANINEGLRRAGIVVERS